MSLKDNRTYLGTLRGDKINIESNNYVVELLDRDGNNIGGIWHLIELVKNIDNMTELPNKNSI